MSTLILIYIYITVFGVIVGAIAYRIHREGQRHDPDR